MFLLLAAALVAQQPAGTGLRGTGDFVVLATSDEAELLAACVQVSPAYEDSMTLQVFDASGALVSRDVVAAGASKMLRLTKSSGPYQVSCSAGRNAVRLAVQGGAVILDARSSGALALYGSLQPLYFSVQRAGRLELDIYAEEPAELALYAPDGTALWRDAIPDHTQRKVALEVKPEWVGAGKLLRLTGKLEGDVRISLDPAIIPLFADGDAAGQILAELRGGLPTTDLDGRLCALSVAQAGSMARVAARLRAADGLTIDLSPEGEIVACGTQPAALRLPRPRGGFAVRDHSVGGKISFGRGSCKAIGERAAEILVQFEGTPYSVRATVTAEEARVLVRGEVASAASEDRPITLMCLIPAPGAEQWFDDIDTARVPLAGASMCKWVPSGAGAVGRVSCYPLGCVAGGPLLGESGLAVAVPLDLPRVFRISYASQPGALVVAFDVGLTPDTRKFPNRATFAVELFRTDRAWGFRDALRRYYALHPVDFQRQIPKIGGWVCWGNLESVPDFADYGFQYHWGPGGVPAV
ncbi:MAG: hypothetical protein H5T86_08810, partial [Armatimonadetes bacterium]|nr:hypothetical protein [Armatimonadota bacterium]